MTTVTQALTGGKKGASLSLRMRRLIVEPEDERAPLDLLLAMDETGTVRTFRSAEEVVRWVTRRDRAAAVRVSTVTTIEWRYMPPGFTPPS